ncbi:indolepyruvate ferredoxin oxidoreductase family protein [Gilvimarinus sp. F26214L]|uniref:indolepyruvate ferredoxin oxidoreductase family protein n=1 Tax=Gilvimarinus sp. DZF01 TaxID=3461371 RepID=UPI004045E3CA
MTGAEGLQTAAKLDDYQLEDRYRRSRGRVFLTGTQALVRIPLMQREMDRRAGLTTGGFISGYRGSPLGGYDQQLWRASGELADAAIEFVPAINEDLAATMVLGTQQVETDEDREVDGVFALWYGKGPGVDRAGDALKHGNTYGSSPHGGVLVVAGDDHGCVSSSMPHQSDVAFMASFIPVLNPASVAEYLDYGLYGFALSRYSGMWVGFKAISETVESAASIELKPLPEFRTPTDFTPPPGGLHYRWPDLPGPQIETRMEAKLKAVAAFARANPLDYRLYNPDRARFGIVTTGKAHLDTLEAMERLGLGPDTCRELGIDVYKVGMVWPLERSGVLDFVHGKSEVLVIEEKRGIVESQIKEYMSEVDHPGEVIFTGKQDEKGEPLIPFVGELSPSLLAPFIAQRIGRMFGIDFADKLGDILNSGAQVEPVAGVRRLPYFCSGCPHNTSTKVPDGSKALAGIGCHFMASWMNRDTGSLIQMGGEGANWAGKSRFTGNKHIFQNLGEGTYFHSGHMALRQAVAAGTNITYKILFNDAVAMTGGQPVDGQLTVPAIAQQVRAEGVQRIAVLSDEPEKYSEPKVFPAGTTLHHRDELQTVQLELREIPGVSVLIFDQTCAAEKRRRRKRGQYPDPAKRVFINHHVCEGCGDCSVQSNCLSVVPFQTPLGRKRRIDQNSCNKDYSCLKGFCPSFVTVEGGQLRKPGAQTGSAFAQRAAALPAPSIELGKSCNLLVGGVGGTGVVTVGAIITMAAHLEGKGSSVLDFMGFAQKGGTVLSYVRLAPRPDDLHQIRIDRGTADVLIACDLVVGSSEKVLPTLRHGQTSIVANEEDIPTADHVLFRDADTDVQRRMNVLRSAAGNENVSSMDANRLARTLMGDTVFSNMIMLGYAWQRGLVPVSLAALERAIVLNDVAVENNLAALRWGRLAAADPEFVQTTLDAAGGPAPRTEPLSFEEQQQYLARYQDRRYAELFADRVRRIAPEGTTRDQQVFHNAVRNSLFRLMSYKDEYEVARLYAETDFAEQIAREFEGNYRLSFNLAPPLLGWRKDAAGRPRKISFGPWMLPVFRGLARLRRLRGTPFDFFGYTRERRMERKLLSDFLAMLESARSHLQPDTMKTAIELARLPMAVRGFGPVKEEAIAAFYRDSARILSRLQSDDDAVAGQRERNAA